MGNHKMPCKHLCCCLTSQAYGPHPTIILLVGGYYHTTMLPLCCSYRTYNVRPYVACKAAWQSRTAHKP